MQITGTRCGQTLVSIRQRTSLPRQHTSAYVSLILNIADHGYPVRVIIPGWIGGRMVKWLTKIIITDKESDNYYHFFDNRILPPQVDKDTTKS